MNTRRPGFTIRDLAVLLTCLGVGGSFVISLSAASRDLTYAAVCASHQATLFGGLMAYVNTYNSFPPHNPYPTVAPSETVNGISTFGWDPNLGWILTYGLGLEPPARFPSGHFKWFGLDPDDLPDVVTCPAADRQKLFTPNTTTPPGLKRPQAAGRYILPGTLIREGEKAWMLGKFGNSNRC